MNVSPSVLRRFGIVAIVTLVAALDTLIGPSRTTGMARTAVRPSEPRTTGSSSSPLLSESNTGTGEGIDSSSDGNYGVVGHTYATTSKSGSFYGGVGGVDQATGSARSLNVGVYGQSTNGTAIDGYTAFNGSGPKVSPTYAVEGYDGSTQPSDGTSDQAGVSGFSTVGIGALGMSVKRIGLYGQTSNTTATGSFGVFGDDANATSGSKNTAVFGLSTFANAVGGESTSGIDVFGTTVKGAGGLFSSTGAGTALRLQTVSTGLIASATNGKKDVMSLDNAGNLILAGTVTQKGSPLIVRTAVDGSHVSTHLAETTESTLEDVGEARVTHGRATVMLESRFAKTIDPARGYVVFLTPEGLLAGQLCVVARTRDRFEVVENRGASTVAFAYRIVAHPVGASTSRVDAPQASTGDAVPWSPPQPAVRVVRPPLQAARTFARAHAR